MRKRPEENLLSTFDTIGWPASPDQERIQRALNTLKMMATVNRSDITADQITIPALAPPSQRQQILQPITAPDGREIQFDWYHEMDLKIPDKIIMKRNKVLDAQAAHDCLQAKTFNEACVDLFRQAQVKGADQVYWFMHQAGNLGDSYHTIGLVIQRPSATAPGRDETTCTKLSRHKSWMGYNADLPSLQGLTCRIYSAEDEADLPSYAIGFPAARLPQSADESKTIPNGQAKLLAKILKYHGAERCLWIDRINQDEPSDKG